MIIKGAVESIVYKNDENGYAVIDINNDGRLVTAVGVFPPITEGEFLSLEGEFVLNSKYGDQFSVTGVKIEKPTSIYSILKYLSSGLFVGVGDVTAGKIVEKFGTETLDIIEFQPSKLAQIRGISISKAMEIGDAFVKMRRMQASIFFLQNLGLSINLAIKIFKMYDAQTESAVSSNPYRLIEDVEGIGFLSADKIAEKLGVKNNGKFRVSAGIMHILKEAVQKAGHTFLPKSELFRDTKQLLGIDEDSIIEEVLCEYEVLGKIMTLKTQDLTAVMLAKHYICEASIASRLVSLCADTREVYLDLCRDIAQFERENNILLHQGQIDAISNCLFGGVNIITGGPGTGKTTIIKCIISILQSKGLSVQLCAPTGRAAKRLAESTGIEAKTIHRLLDLDFKDGKGHFTYNENSSVDADIVIIDEVSMCDEYVFNSLVSAVKHGGKLIMVGDKDQLPSVGAGNVLADIIASKVIPVSYLTQIYRQAEESLIVKNAHFINSGRMPVLDNNKKDFFYSQKSGGAAIRDTVIEMVSTRIPKFLGVSSLEIQVLCPMKKGLSGADNLNTELQNAINPSSFKKAEYKGANITYRVGDKVIHVVNNYQMEWTRPSDFGLESGVGVFNGDMGQVFSIDAADGSLVVEFDDGKKAKYPAAGREDELKLAYAITVHKSQGSEFDVVILPLMSGSYTICTRNLLYTAVTRAKKMVLLVGDKGVIEFMVGNNYTAKRYTLLKEMLIDEEERRCLKKQKN